MHKFRCKRGAAGLDWVADNSLMLGVGRSGAMQEWGGAGMAHRAKQTFQKSLAGERELLKIH